MGIPDHLTCLLRNLYAGQEATVRTKHETTDWFQIGKGVPQGRILSPCLFNLYAEYVMWNARLDESQAGVKIAGRNINSLRCVDDTTQTADSEEELKSLLERVKEESEKAGLKLVIQKVSHDWNNSACTPSLQPLRTDFPLYACQKQTKNLKSPWFSSRKKKDLSVFPSKDKTLLYSSRDSQGLPGTSRHSLTGRSDL